MRAASLFAPIRVFLIVPAVILAACSTVQPERSFGRDVDDANASLGIKAAMTRAEGYALGGVDVEVTDGVALLTGTVPREEDRRQAECLAWSAIAVRTVENMVEISSAASLQNRSRDALISQRIRGRILSDRAVRSVNYNVETVNGRVYLLGVARTRGELERAANHASLVDGVQEVITFVRVIGEDVVPEPRGERQASVCSGEAAPSLEPPQDLRDAPVTPID